MCGGVRRVVQRLTPTVCCVSGAVQPAEHATPDVWRATMATNVDAPLFLTNALLPQLRAKPQARILHISSGAAHYAFAGWTSYCVSKSAFFMLYQCMRDELGAADVPVLVGSVKPGVVDTPMQAVVRGSDFPGRERFAEMHAKGVERAAAYAEGPHTPPSDALDTCDNVATFLTWLLRDTSDAEFVEKEWDIREPEHHDRWITTPPAGAGAAAGAGADK